MNQYQYEQFSDLFSPNSVLRKIEQREKEGWELYLLEPIRIFLFGTGGTGGLTAVMRKATCRPAATSDGCQQAAPADPEQ